MTAFFFFFVTSEIDGRNFVTPFLLCFSPSPSLSLFLLPLHSMSLSLSISLFQKNDLLHAINKVLFFFFFILHVARCPFETIGNNIVQIHCSIWTRLKQHLDECIMHERQRQKERETEALFHSPFAAWPDSMLGKINSWIHLFLVSKILILPLSVTQWSYMTFHLSKIDGYVFF